MGRFVFAFLRISWDERHILAASAWGGALWYGMVLLAPSYKVAVGAILIGSLISGATYPCILALAGNRFPRTKAKVYSYMQTSLAFSGILTPPTIGVLADHGVPLRRALTTSPLAAVALGIAALTWAARGKQENIERKNS